jgi:hypothetical protein
MATHAIARTQQRSMLRGLDGDTVLVAVALAPEAELCMFDPQASTMALG